MIRVDENFINDWIYKILNKIDDDPTWCRDELLKLSSFIINAPKIGDTVTNYPKIRKM